MIITLMWHAVPPTMEEPCEFKSGIQSKLTDEQWEQLLTDGTPINQRWKSQVDVIAFFLKQLRDAHVPVIWRPYHEMNGNWFWWSKPGENGYMKLYQMLFDRLVNYHGINNLIWVFNGNETGSSNVETYDNFYPGSNYVDVLATDVYHNNYSDNDYQLLLKLADGKPIALGEVGHMPSADIMKKQPRWAWFMTWSEILETGNTWQERMDIYNCEQTITLDEISSICK
jgi:mannan endo-1,4-beta-mannosidase